MLESSSVAAQLEASQEKLSSMKLVMGEINTELQSENLNGGGVSGDGTTLNKS
jgi:hypothetical protein